MVRSDVRAEWSGSGGDGDGLGVLVDGIAADVGMSGVIRVDVEGRLAVQRAYGLAHRGLGVPNDGRHAVRDRQRLEGSHRAGGDEPRRGW